MSIFTLAISCLATSNLPWFMDLAFQVPMQYCSLQHHLASITSHIHNWVLFFLWLHPFILSGVISPLISSSILCTYRPRVFIFQCPIFLPFQTVHVVLKTRILKWFAIHSSSEPHSVCMCMYTHVCMYMYTHMYMNHLVVHLKYCKLTILY